MFANIHNLPVGQALYTVFVTDQPAGAQDMGYDEVDVVAPRTATAAQVIAAADLAGYEHCRVIGVADQSAGEMLAQAPNGDLRKEA